MICQGVVFWVFCCVLHLSCLVSLLQLHRCPDLSDCQQKISSVLSYNEKLLQEKEALSEELNSCVDKVVKIRLLPVNVQCVP